MDDRITGVMIYYYFVCKRKLWYFCHDIRMETENEDVILGKYWMRAVIRKKDKHINIDDIINIDFISEHKELHEVKKQSGGRGGNLASEVLSVLFTKSEE